MAKKAKKRKLTQAHKDAISASHAKRRKEKASSRAASVSASAGGPTQRRRRVLKNGRAPEGVHVLRRNGNGKDLIECNADEVLKALRVFRRIEEMVCTS